MTNETALELTPIVESTAHYWDNRTPAHVSFDDLVGVAWIGVLEAEQKYDAAKGASFATFARHRMKGAILDHLRACDWVPRELRAKGKKIEDATFRLTAANGAPPEPEEIAAELGMDLADVQDAEALTARTLHSLDATTGEGGSFHDTVAAPLRGPSLEARSLIRAAMAALDDRERDIIERVYLRDQKARAVGVELGITESRVSQIRKTALAKMQEEMAA